MKENNGNAARRKLTKKLSIVLSIFSLLIGSLVIADTKYADNPMGGRRQSLFNKIRGAKRGGGSVRTPVSKEFSRILAADLHLIEIDSDSRELRRSPADSYGGVYGTFCKLNFKAHKEDPSSSKYMCFRYLRNQQKR